MNIALPAACASIVACMGAPAFASDARIAVSAYVPISCEMTFRPDFQVGTDNSVRLGSVTQYCNTRYQMTVSHIATASGVELRLGDVAAVLTGQSTLIESSGDPINATSALSAHNIAPADALPLGASLVMVVTPIGF